MNNREIVLAFWRHLHDRAWEPLRLLLADDLVVDWPTTGERIVGPRDFVAVNAEYPDGWSIDVRNVVASGAKVASEVWVPHDSLGVFAVASFWTVTGGRIQHGVEYWTEPGAEDRPAWRAPYTGLLRTEPGRLPWRAGPETRGAR